MSSSLVHRGLLGLTLFCLPGISCAIEPPADLLSGLISEDFKVREKSQGDLLKWASVDRDAAVAVLLGLASDSDEPEIRQRSLAVLRDLADLDYLNFGEGYVGILMLDEKAMVPGDEEARSVIRVRQVVEGTAGHEAGLQVDDLIVGMDTDVWRGGAASLPFGAKIRELKPGTKVTLKVVRDGKLQDLVVKLGKRPIGADPRFFGQMLDLEAAEKAARDDHFKMWMNAWKERQKAKQ